jgi:hypothetical protein
MKHQRAIKMCTSAELPQWITNAISAITPMAMNAGQGDGNIFGGSPPKAPIVAPAKPSTPYTPPPPKPKKSSTLRIFSKNAK